MKHSLSAAVALALGFGLASVGAQAHGMQHQQSMQHHQAAQHASQMTKQAQQRLQAAGLYRGPIDGVAGPKTRHAVAEFQRQNNLRPTARLDRNTRDRLMSGNQAVGVGSTAPNTGNANPQTSGPTAGTQPTTPPPAAHMTGPNMPGPQQNMNGAGGNMPAPGPSH